MSAENGDPEISQIFSQKVERRFQRDFGRLLHHQDRGRKTMDEMKRVDHQMNVKLIEANETAELLRRQLKSRNEEIDELKKSGNAAKERAEDLQKQLNELKLEMKRGQRASKDFSQNEMEIKLRLNDYKTALSKYKTWFEFADKQMRTMKILLQERDGWTEESRYKIFFAYRATQLEVIEDEKVSELAAGSVIDYPGAIEEVEGITASGIRPKFRSTFTQTLSQQSSSNQQSPSALDNSFAVSSEQSGEVEQMSAMELRLIECEKNIEQLECENAKLREQHIILSNRAKHVELLEEQKQDIQMQNDILRRQNEELIHDHERLKCVFDGGLATRNSLEDLVRNAEKYKTRNIELEQKVQMLEGQSKDTTNLAESKRIAQIFKQKYEQELAELRNRLNKYEPLYASDTTRILRFAQHNPLDEAHDEHFVKQVATKATSSSTAPNPLKRRKMDVEDDASLEQTFLAEGETEEMDRTQMRQFHLQIANVKEQMKQNDENQAEHMKQYRELVALLCGYNIRLDDDGFCEAENVHSKNCTFLFQKHAAEVDQPAGVDLLDNECARKWKDVLENYLVRYQSVPAFLSAVNISLVESPETPLSSKPPSSLSNNEEESTSQEPA